MILILIVSDSPFLSVSCGNNFSTILDRFIPYSEGFISFVAYCPCNITAQLTYRCSSVPLNGFLAISGNWIAVIIFDFIFLLMEIISLGMLNHVIVTFL